MGGVENLWIYVIIGVVILAGAIAYGVNLTRGRGGDTRTLDREAPAAPGLPGEDLDRRPPTGRHRHRGRRPRRRRRPPRWRPPARGRDRADRTARAASSSDPSRPAGRLARLRARLARSNTALGKGLLALLSRGKLDEEAWEEVEDTLIASDLGVEATTELVESLRTRVKVDGTTDEATVREWLREDLLGARPARHGPPDRLEPRR